jgi:hypothetical protein
MNISNHYSSFNYVNRKFSKAEQPSFKERFRVPKLNPKTKDTLVKSGLATTGTGLITSASTHLLSIDPTPQSAATIDSFQPELTPYFNFLENESGLIEEADGYSTIQSSAMPLASYSTGAASAITSSCGLDNEEQKSERKIPD